MKRGRKSAEDLAVLIGTENLVVEDPPEGLTERQREIWRAVMASEPKKFFATEATRDILAMYCQHRSNAEGVAAVINSFDPQWLKSEEGAARYDVLTRIHQRATTAATAALRSLRLTNQSRYQTTVAARAASNESTGVQFPWDIVK